MNSTSTARAISDLTAGTILATVDIRAPIDRVFSAITDPEQLVKWWGSPEAYQTTAWTADLRVGGRWVSEGRGSDGSTFKVEGEYLVVDPPNTLVHTWKADWTGDLVTTVTWRLAETATGTRVTTRHDGFAGAPEACRTHESGWELVLGWLEGAQSEPEAASPTFLVRLIPPRPTFIMDMDESERAVMMAHVGYWMERKAEGVALAFGPVADANGAWGLGLLRLPDVDAVRAFEARDPAVMSGRGFHYEISPMPQLVI